MKAKLQNTFASVLAAVLTAVFMPLYAVGYVLYLTSKIVRAAGFALTLNFESAKDEFYHFFKLSIDVGDL